jgi:DNA-binding CsgD family transcriptional regulator/PAS domain-containing protein
MVEPRDGGSFGEGHNEDDEPGRHSVRRTGTRARTAAAGDFPLFVWDLPDGIIRIVNPTAEALMELPHGQLTGRRITDFVAPAGIVEMAISALATGALSATLTKREVVGRASGPLPVWVWTRSVDVTADAGSAVSLVIPETDLGRLGMDPGRPWRQLGDVVIGLADMSWTIRQISSDVCSVLGAESRDVVGRSMRDLIHPDDEDGFRLFDLRGAAQSMRGRLRRSEGGWTEVGLFFSAVEMGGARRIAFALVADGSVDEQPDRIAELEGRLLRIAEEVRAASVLRAAEPPPAPAEVRLGDLSRRQWEIVSRLLEGQRVDTIARELYLSPSTVRNHLSAIFRRFGVHSQRDLCDLLRAG